MEIKYIGPKAVISHHGVSFKDGKDDKYVYINNAMQIFKAIDHEYEKNRLYYHNIENREYTSEDIFQELKKIITGFNDEINSALIGYKKYLQSQEDEVASLTHLSKEDKTVYINNLQIMRDYRTQRFINKHIYELIIKAIVDTIVTNKLHEIQTPFNERFWHILQTIEGWLSHEHNISSTLKTTTDEENIIILLHINKIY